MGCSTSHPEPQVVPSRRERRESEVLVGVHVRAEAAFRRQRMARELEQTVAMRAHLEVQKAKIRKSSIDCGRRPSRPLTSLFELPEAEKSEEEDGKEEGKKIALVAPFNVSGKVGEYVETPDSEKNVKEGGDEIALLQKDDETPGSDLKNEPLCENTANAEVEKLSRGETVDIKFQKIKDDGTQTSLNTDVVEANDSNHRDSRSNEDNADQMQYDEKPTESGSVVEVNDQGVTSHESCAYKAPENYEEHTKAVKETSVLDETSAGRCAEALKPLDQQNGDEEELGDKQGTDGRNETLSEGNSMPFPDNEVT